MKYYLDSAKLDEIKYAYEFLGIDGVTTNPKHIQNSGKPFMVVIKEIAAWVEGMGLSGKEVFPVSVEINPHLTNHEDMIKEAHKISAISPNFVIKIPCTLQGCIAAKKLEEQGISTNLTLVFSPSQGIQAGRIGTMFVSPFVGWKEQSGEDTSYYIKDLIETYRIQGYQTQIIVAALRTPKQIVEAAKWGAGIVTCGLAVYQDSLYHPFTDYGLSVFKEAWDNTSLEESREDYDLSGTDKMVSQS